MRRIITSQNLLIITILGIILVSIVLSAFKAENNTCVTHHDTYTISSYTLRATRYKLLLADTPAKWEYGLMNIKSKQDICNADGMIFKFPIALPQTFWNKNTLVDLDVYWMNGEKVEGKSELPAISRDGLQTISSPTSVNTVLEIIR